jgi:adenine deaminase
MLVVKDLRGFQPVIVTKSGEVVARDGRYEARRDQPTPAFDNTVHIDSLTEAAFELRPTGEECPVIGIIPDSIVTRHESCGVCVDPSTKCWTFDADRDLSLIACIERHQATGRIGLGLVRGFRFRQDGALGSSVAHDAHNLVITGTNPADMLACAHALQEMGGGLVAVSNGAPMARLPLEAGGLMSTRDAATVRRQLDKVNEAARSLGCPLPAPFATLSFLCLSVIPELRITDRGIFDVAKQQILTV